MALKIILGIVVLLAAVLLFAATKPSTFRVQRSVLIQAQPEKVFSLINDLHNWSQWAPQDREDSSMKRSFGGPESGVGAVSDWTGGGSAGKGRMEIVESVSGKLVAVKVDFTKPFEAHNRNEFTLDPHGQSTTVTWTMQGTNLYVMKVMSVFTNMDKMAGKHFETGLANLKTAAER